MADPVGVGIVGAGYWGTKLVEEYLSSERRKGNLKLLKVCDTSLSALLACKKRFSIEDSLLTQNVGDLMEDSRICAVHIATPNETHYALARMALEADKDILLEKPMTLSSREAYTLVDLAASRGRVLHVGHIFRFNSALRAAHQLLASGAIGKIFYARVQWTDYCPPFPDRDIIFDLGPHPVDVLNQLLDAWPTRVSGFGRAYRNSPQHHEVAYGIAEFHDGVFAHVELSWLHPTKAREVTIVGSDGTLVVDCHSQRLVRSSHEGAKELPISANNTIESEIDWFADCVSKRSISIESGLIGARTVEVLETMRASLCERPLSIAPPSTADHTATLIAVLEMARKGTSEYELTNREPGNAELEKYAGLLVGLGLVSRIAAKDGTSYEITPTGSRFLEEYHDIERDLRKGAFRPRQAPKLSGSDVE